MGVSVSFKRLRLNVGVYYSIHGPVSPMDFVCSYIAEIVPYIKEYSKAEDIAEYMEVFRIAQNVAKHTQKHQYSRESFFEYVKTVALKDFTVGLLDSLFPQLKLIQFPSSLDENMILLFKVVNAVGSFEPRSDYGLEVFDPNALQNEQSSPEPKKSQSARAVKMRDVVTVVEREDNKKDVNDNPNIIALKRFFNNRFEESTGKYFWQWKVCTADYETLRALLLAVDFSVNTRNKIRACARQLSLYIAEWYKREYHGHESDDCLGDLGIGSDAFNREIWENSNFKGLEPFRTEETGRTEWLYSIRLLGGFPIKYTETSSRFDALFCEIWADDREAGALSEEQIEELSYAFEGSKVIKDSLVAGSLKEYYAYLRKYEDMPIAEEDKLEPPFNTFIKHLQEGREKYYQFYIRHQWRFYSDPRDNRIDSELHFTFGRKEDSNYIPFECLKAWRIPSPENIQEFWIEVSVDGISIKKIRFVKSGPGSYPYVGEEGSMNLDINYSDTDCVYVNLVTESGDSYEIYRPISAERSIQVYKTNTPFEWSTKKRSMVASVVLYDPVYFSAYDSALRVSTKSFSRNQRDWNWVVLSEELKLKDEKDNIISYVPFNNTIDISFRLLTDTLRYSNFRDIKVYMNGKYGDDVQYLPLMIDGGLQVKYTPFNSDKTQKLHKNEYDVYYRKFGERDYQLMTPNHGLSNGVIQIRVCYREMNVSVSKLVYYIPSDYPVNRLLENNKISFSRHIDQLYCPVDETNERYRFYPPDGDGSYRYYDSLTSGYAPSKDTIPFIIGDINGECAQLDVLRAVQAKEIYVKGETEPILRYTGGTIVNIPKFLRHNFSVREINEAGIRHTACDGLTNDSGIKYYRFAERNSPKASRRNQIQLETNQEQYAFYYWSALNSEAPVKLKQSFDDETKVLTLDLSLLEANERGIVFQGIKGGLRPRHYFEPIVGERNNLRERLDVVKCFNIATEYGTPFQVFTALTSLFSVEDVSGSLQSFLMKVFDSRGWNPSSKDLSALNRFSNEFGFEWIMLPRFKVYRAMRSSSDQTIGKSSQKARDVINALFRSTTNVHKNDKDFLERLLAIYWKMPVYTDWDFRRSQKLENMFAQSLRGLKDDFSIFNIKSLNERQKVLADFLMDKRLYEETYFLLLKYLKK